MFELTIANELSADEDGTFHRGHITLGKFTESFDAPDGYWSASEYRLHWRAQVMKLLAGSESVALLVTDPRPDCASCMAWVLWREDPVVFVQQHILWREKDGAVRDLAAPDQYIGKRRTRTDDGDRISQWTVRVSDLGDYIERCS